MDGGSEIRSNEKISSTQEPTLPILQKVVDLSSKIQVPRNLVLATKYIP